MSSGDRLDHVPLFEIKPISDIKTKQKQLWCKQFENSGKLESALIFSCLKTYFYNVPFVKKKSHISGANT